MRQRLQQFMMGRYGGDQLGKVLTLASLILLLVSLFFDITICYILGVGVLIYTYWRMFSKNVSKCYEENQKFVNMRYRAVVKWDKQKKQWAQRKTHRFFKCPQCSQKVRVPKGRGKICITCPKCRNEFTKRS